MYCQKVQFPLKNLPVVESAAELEKLDGPGILSLRGISAPGYEQVAALAEQLCREIKNGPLYLALREDMAKALGQQLALRSGSERPILCIDRVELKSGDYLDVGTAVGPAFPVVVKTLILSR